MPQHLGMSFDYVLPFSESTLNWGLIKKRAMITDSFLGYPGCQVLNVGGFVSPSYLI